MEELKPCPHCNCKEIYVHKSKVRAYVVCPVCGMSGPNSIEGACNDFKAKAIHAWNTLPRYVGKAKSE